MDNHIQSGNAGDAIVQIGVAKLHHHPDNPRKDLGDVSELADSLRKNGVMQNLTVIPAGFCMPPEEQPEDAGDGYFVLIGNRRLEAARMAGIEAVPCRIVSGIGKREQVAIMLEENMQRADLTILEQAEGFQLMLDLGETVKSIAEKTGFGETTIRHRLNIARLDRGELRKKEQDDNFQLALKDLYALEKVADVRKRNEILKSARDSREIASMALRAVAEAARDSRFKQIAEMAKKAGIEKAPKGAENEMYWGKWDTVREFDLDKEPPKNLSVKDGGRLYYLRHFHSLHIIRKHKKVKKELTPEEMARKERDGKRKRLRAVVREMDAGRRGFILNIINGRIAAAEDEEAVREMAWRFLLEAGAYLSASNMVKFFAEKEYYNCSEEELAGAKEKIDGLSCTQSMLLAVHAKAEDAEVADYRGCYMATTGAMLKKCYEILKPYGWTFRSEEEVRVLDGTHELYAPKED